MFSERSRRKVEAQAYLDNKSKMTEERHSQTEEERVALEKYLETPFTDATWANEGVLEYDMGEAGVWVEIEYDSLLGEELHRHAHEQKEIIGDRIPTESMRRLKKLKFTSDGASFDLEDVLSHISIYFATERNTFSKVDIDSQGTWISKEDMVLVFEDLRTLQGLITMLHEIGHAYEDGSLPSERVEPEVSFSQKLAHIGLREHGKAEHIKTERTASAYALNVLRKFLPPPILKCAQQTLHDSLESYHRHR